MTDHFANFLERQAAKLHVKSFLFGIAVATIGFTVAEVLCYLYVPKA